MAQYFFEMALNSQACWIHTDRCSTLEQWCKLCLCCQGHIVHLPTTILNTIGLTSACLNLWTPVCLSYWECNVIVMTTNRNSAGLLYTQEYFFSSCSFWLIAGILQGTLWLGGWVCLPLPLWPADGQVDPKQFCQPLWPELGHVCDMP